MMNEGKQEERHEEAVPLVCTACGATPRHMTFSVAANQVIHSAILRVRDVPEVCGGAVAVAGDEWRAFLAPGRVVVCGALKRLGTAHLVRLGRAGNARNRSWTGTALCGFVQAAGHHWVPLSPRVQANVALCAQCEAARQRGAAE